LVTNPTSTYPSATPVHPHDALEYQLLSAWVEVAHVGLCVIDDTARVVMLNADACRKFGVDGLDVLNMPLKTLLRGIDGNLNLIQWLSTPGFDGERQVTVQAVDGVRHLLLKSHSVRTETGDRYKVVAITDVTQLTHALRESQLSRQQSQASNAGAQHLRVSDPPLRPDE
jgi:transcriptional regulator with PAS, ATPase and Fis domain